MHQTFFGAARAIRGTTLTVDAQTTRYCAFALDSVARLEAPPFTDHNKMSGRFGQSDLANLIRKVWPQFLQSSDASAYVTHLFVDTGRSAHCYGSDGESIHLDLLVQHVCPTQSGATHRLCKIRTVSCDGVPMNITSMQIRRAAIETSEQEFNAQAAMLRSCISEQGIDDGLLAQPHLLVENARRFPMALLDRSTRRLHDPERVREILADRARTAIRNGEIEDFFAFAEEDDALYPRPRAQAAVPIYGLSGNFDAPELFLVLRLGFDSARGAPRIETPTVLSPQMQAHNRSVLEGIRQRWRQHAYGLVA